MASSTRVPKLLSFDSLYLEDNVRTEACEQVPAMVKSLRLEGFKDNHPLVVSEKDDGRYLVLCGNRRYKGLDAIRDDDSVEFSRVLPAGKIPSLVYRGLTREEEIDLRIDHGEHEDRVKLDKWSEFQAVRQLVFAHPEDTQAAVARKLGRFHGDDSKNAGQPNRAWAQPMVYLARLPDFVQEEYRKLTCEGKDATLFRHASIVKLHKIYDDDFNEFPDGDSPTFATAWKAVINPEPKTAETAAAADKSAPKSIKPEHASAQAKGASSRLVKRLLLAITNQGGDVPTLDAEALKAETDSLILADIRAYLPSDDYATLLGEAQNARLDREAQAQEADKLAEEAAS